MPLTSKMHAVPNRNVPIDGARSGARFVDREGAAAGDFQQVLIVHSYVEVPAESKVCSLVWIQERQGQELAAELGDLPLYCRSCTPTKTMSLSTDMTQDVPTSSTVRPRPHATPDFSHCG